jgi:hypothetical protein
MPVNLPLKQATDPRLLSFLAQIAGSEGRICLSDEEYEMLEGKHFFQDAWRRRLISIDGGGEWSTGAVVSITREGRIMIGEPAPESLWRRLEVMLRRIGGADG